MAQARRGRLRVLHVSQPTSEGTATVVRSLAGWGVAEGHDVTVCCPAEGPLRGWVEGYGATWVDLPMGRAPSPRDLGHVLRLRHLVAASDLVHLHSSKAGAVGRLAVRLTRDPPPVVFVPHGWSWLLGGRQGQVYRLFERSFAGACDRIVAVSRDEQQEGLRTLGAARPVVLIENGVDADAFGPEGETAERATAPLLVLVGRLSRQKGQDLAIRALARLAATDARLRLVGSGPDRDALAALAADLGVADRVELVGQAAPAPHLRAADVVVAPSRWEGLALALLEAMATGATVVASDRGSSVALGDAGVVLPVEDEDRFVELLVEHLDRLLAEPDERSALGAAARARAVASYSLERTRESWVRMWHDLAPAG